MIVSRPEIFRPNKIGSQKGAGLIEFALVFPLLLLLVVGLLEVGQGYKLYQNITNATREGARLSTQKYHNQPTKAPDFLRDRITNYLSALGLQTSYYQGAGTNISGTTSWEYGDYPNGSYLLINQAKTFPKMGSPGTELSGSEVSLSYPYSFTSLGPVIRLVVPNSSFANSILIKNSTLIQNE